MAGIRRAEITAALAVAADAGMGHPPDLTLSSVAVATRLARAMDLSREDVQACFAVSMMRFVGCTAETQLAASAFGDEVIARGFLARADFGSPTSVLGLVGKHLAADRPWSERIPRVLRAVARMGSLFEAAAAHCEVGQVLGRGLGYDERVVAALGKVYERFDGKGVPKRLRESEVPIEAAVAALAHDVALYHRIGGQEAVLAMARERSGGAHDPKLVAALENHASDVLPALELPSPWRAALDEEPRPHAVLEGAALDEAMACVGDFADLKGIMRAGHSRSVARLASAAATASGLDADAARELAWAGHVHDLGVVATTASLWDKRGPLTDADREAIRLHPYVAERCLVRSEPLAKIGKIVSLHHERLDGSGYPKGISADALGPAARLLALADTAVAMQSERPHRAALAAETITRQIRQACASNVLCAQAARAVLDAMGQPLARSAIENTAGLSERELEVLRLLASGRTIKEVAAALDLATKTVDNHAQRIYGKLGVTTRAAATAWAIRHGIAR